MSTTLQPLTESELQTASASVEKLRAALQQVLFGQDELINHVINGLLARGHMLLEGLPGLGKTELVKGLAKTLQLVAKRIQFTPDLLPGDITGNPMLQDTADGRRFVFQPGPIFANLVLADQVADPDRAAQTARARRRKRSGIGKVGHFLIIIRK